MPEKILEYENAHFLHSLFADKLELLKELEEALSIRTTTRDAWVKFEGEQSRIDQATEVFADVEATRRQGVEITPSSFRFALKAAAQSIQEQSKLNELLEFRLLGTRGKPPVSARNSNQLDYLRKLASFDVVFGIGPAGTGKTFLAMAWALHQLKEREIDRILLTRPAVEAGEALGFLPGALEEKVLPYLRPLYDAMHHMLDANEAQKLAEKNLIEIAPLAYMRGRTLNRACVILDEAQNASREQMLMFLTRLGEDSQCIVTGDPSQIDLRPKHKSGLLEAKKILRGVEGIAFTEFQAQDVVRHPVVARIIEAYDKGREGEAEKVKS